MRVALACSLAVVLAAPLNAQKGGAAPKRPKLDAGADTNDARAYYEFGNRPKTPWKKAREYYYWAARLEPDNPLYAYAMYLARYYGQPPEWRRELSEGADYVVNSKEAAEIDTLFYEAIIRNPFPYGATNGCSVPDWVMEIEDPMWSGVVFEDYGCLKQAADKFAEVLAKNPKLLWLREHRARALYGVGAYGAAIQELQIVLDSLHARDQKRLQRFYQSKEIYESMIGQAYAAQQDFHNAKQAYGRALTENLAFFPAHAQLGRIGLAQEDLPTAIAEFEQAVELRPDDAALRYELGVALLQAGRAADAESQLRKAIELEPHFSRAYYNLAVALKNQGKKAEAPEQFQAFLSRAPRRYANLIKVAQAQVVAAKE